MRIAYFPNYAALNSGPVLDAVLQSCRAAGLDVVPNIMDADAAIIWCVLWNGRMQPNKQVYEHYRQLNRPVIVIEVGALQRNVTWKIALNNITAQGYYGHKENLDWDRPCKLGIKLSHNSLNHGKILVAGQHNKSLQLQGVDQESWYVDQIANLNTNKQIVVRAHPRCPLDKTKFPKNVIWEQPKKIPGTYDSYDMHWDFDAVINYNSGPGIQATIAGVPVVVDSSSLAYNLSDREQWLVEICHTEYTIDEIKQGLWIKRIGLER